MAHLHKAIRERDRLYGVQPLALQDQTIDCMQVGDAQGAIFVQGKRGVLRGSVGIV